MKKIIAAIQAGILLLGTTVLAEQVRLNSTNVNKSTVTLSGSLPVEYAGQNVSLQIIKPNGSVGGVSDIFWLREVASDENGEFSHSFLMPETDISGGDTTGTYKIYAGSKGLTSSNESTFYYCTALGRKNYIDSLEEADEAVLVNSITSLEGRLILEQMGVLMPEYDDLTPEQKSSVHSKLLSGDFDEEGDLIKTFNDAMIIELLNANLTNNDDAMNEVRAFGDYMGIDYGIYDNLSTAEAAFFNQRMDAAKGSLWQNAEVFKKNAGDSIALIDINSVSDYRNIWEAVSKYLDNFEFAHSDVEYYLSLTEEIYIYTINKALTNQGFTTAEAVNAAFSGAVAAVKAQKVQSAGGTSGGGGSSRGGGGVALGAGTPSITQSVQNPQDIFFNDVPETHWAYECIKTLKEKGVLNGDEKGNFNPQQTLTREIFVTMLSLGLNLPAGEKTDFSDVSDDAWYADYIARAAKANIVKGIDNENFGVGTEISRQDMAVMIYRAAKYKKAELMPEDAGFVFSDDAQIAFYAKEAVYSLKNSGMINGIDEQSFAPLDKSTKAQAARLIYTLMNKN